jgi:hypothetical protein
LKRNWDDNKKGEMVRMGQNKRSSCRLELPFNSPRITNFILRLLFTGRTEGLRTVVCPITGMYLFEIWEALLWTDLRGGGGGGGGGGNAAGAADEDDSVGQRPSCYGIAPYLVKKVPVHHEAQSFIILNR